MSGGGALLRETIVLFTENSNPIWQKQFYWFTAWCVFFVVMVTAWWVQFRKANHLSKLDIEFKDLFITYTLPLDKEMELREKTFLTIVLSITNPQNEANTIRSCRFIIYKNNGFFRKKVEIEGEKRDSAFLKDGDNKRKLGSLETIIFQQGIPQDYAVSFKVNKGNIPFASIEDTLANKPFTVFLVDSYKKEYKYKGITSKDLIKTRTRYSYH